MREREEEHTVAITVYCAAFARTHGGSAIYLYTHEENDLAAHAHRLQLPTKVLNTLHSGI